MPDLPLQDESVAACKGSEELPNKEAELRIKKTGERIQKSIKRKI